MPAKSKEQQKFMAMCLYSPEKVKGECPPRKVAKEFAQTKKGKSKNGKR